MLLPASQLKKLCKCGNPVRTGVRRVTYKHVDGKKVFGIYANSMCADCDNKKNKKYYEERRKKMKADVKMCCACGVNEVRRGAVKSPYKKKDGTVSEYKFSRCPECWAKRHRDYYLRTLERKQNQNSI
jgi:hypothetical protein